MGESLTTDIWWTPSHPFKSSLTGASGPVPTVAKTPLVGGKWVKGTAHPFELVITSNATAPNIPTGGATQIMPWAK